MRAEISHTQWIGLREQLQKQWKPGNGISPVWSYALPEDIEPRPAWWNPTDSTEESFYVRNGGYRQAIKYERGYLYYWELWE